MLDQGRSGRPLWRSWWSDAAPVEQRVRDGAGGDQRQPVTVAASASSLRLRTRSARLPLTTNANALGRPSAPMVQPASAAASPRVPVFACTFPRAQAESLVTNRRDDGPRVPV